MRKNSFLPWPWLFLLFVSALFFNHILFRHNIFIPGDFLRSDTLSQNLPFKYELYQSLKAGRLPFWSEEIFNGYPLLAEGQTGAFYPINLIFFLVFPFITAYNMAIFANFVTGLWGAFFLARSFSISIWGSLLAALSFGFSGFLVTHITHQNIVSAAVWLPWLLAAIFHYFQNSRRRWLFVLTAVTAIQFLAGSPQIAFYSLVAAAIFWAGLTWKKRIAKKTLLLFLFVLFGLGIAAIQLLPSWELARHSTRTAGLGNVALESLPYHPRNLLTFFAPYIFGDPGKGTYPRFGGDWGMFWENCGYVGIVTLLLGLAAALFSRQKKRHPVIGLTAISLLLGLGKYGPLFWIYYLPFFNFFRVTGRFLVAVCLGLALLGGWGLDWLVTKTKERFSGFWVKVLTPFVFLIAALDLFLFGYRYNPVWPAAEVLALPAIAQKIKEDQTEPFRIYTIGGTQIYDRINRDYGGWRHSLSAQMGYLNSLDPDLNMLYGVDQSSGYAGLFLTGDTRLDYLVNQGIELKEKTYAISEQSLRLLGWQNVKYLISCDRELEGKGLSLVSKTGDREKYFLYKNSYFLARARLLEKVEIGRPGQFWSRLSAKDFDWENTVYLEETPLVASSEKDGNVATDDIKLLEQSNGLAKYKVSLRKDTWFLLSQTYYPGWKAVVDNRSVPIFLANANFQVIPVSAGDHEITFRFSSSSFRLGMFVSAFSLVSIIGLLFLTKRGTGGMTQG